MYVENMEVFRTQADKIKLSVNKYIDRFPKTFAGIVEEAEVFRVFVVILGARFFAVTAIAPRCR